MWFGLAVFIAICILVVYLTPPIDVDAIDRNTAKEPKSESPKQKLVIPKPPNWQIKTGSYLHGWEHRFEGKPIDDNPYYMRREYIGGVEYMSAACFEAGYYDASKYIEEQKSKDHDTSKGETK